MKKIGGHGVSTKDKSSKLTDAQLTSKIEEVQNAITRLQLLSNGGESFKNLREAILWLLKIRTEEIKLIPILSKSEDEEEEGKL